MFDSVPMIEIPGWREELERIQDRDSFCHFVFTIAYRVERLPDMYCGHILAHAMAVVMLALWKDWEPEQMRAEATDLLGHIRVALGSAGPGFDECDECDE